MSEAKATEAKRPKVTKFYFRDAVHLGGSVRNSIQAGDMASILERTPGGVLVRYETGDGKGGKARRESFIPDSNIASMDLELGQ